MGGCWSAAIDRKPVAPLARAFAKEGFAVRTLKYRRLGQPGGGWPGTVEDVGDGNLDIQEESGWDGDRTAWAATTAARRCSTR